MLILSFEASPPPFRCRGTPYFLGSTGLMFFLSWKKQLQKYRPCSLQNYPLRSPFRSSTLTTFLVKILAHTLVPLNDERLPYSMASNWPIFSSLNAIPINTQEVI